MTRFKLDELVRVIARPSDRCSIRPGSIGTIEMIGAVDITGSYWDYGIGSPDEPDWIMGIMEHQLAKIEPPADVLGITHEAKKGKRS